MNHELNPTKVLDKIKKNKKLLHPDTEEERMKCQG